MGRIAKFVRPVEGLPERVMILGRLVDEDGLVEVCPLGERSPVLLVSAADLVGQVKAVLPEPQMVPPRGFWRYLGRGDAL